MTDEKIECWHKHPNGGGWVEDTARVDETAYIGPGAVVAGNAEVYGCAQISGNAQISGKSRVYGTAQISGKSRVYGNAHIYGSAVVSGNARVHGDSAVSGHALVFSTPIYLSGFEHPVTITNTHVQIGCQCHTLEEWIDMDPPEECPRLEAAREAIITLARLHQEEK